MKKMIIVSFLILSMLSAKQLLVNTNEALSVKAMHTLNENRNTINFNNNNSREEITLFEWDFESEEWIDDAGWELTSGESNSASNSYVSPNDSSTFSNNWFLRSPSVELPQLGDGEIMRFKFWLLGDTPDTDGNGDNYLEDYYRVSLIDLDATPWHVSANGPEQFDGEGYWCADEEISINGGYLDSWLQFLDSPSVNIPEGSSSAILNANLRYELESPAGATVNGSCTDGWDAANVRVSIDGGQTWDLLVDTAHPYDFDCGYGWIWNDSAYENRQPLNHLAPGWGGSSGGWFNFTADLSNYAGNDVIVRFAFGADAGYSTIDNSALTGFQVDDITILIDDDNPYNDDCDDSADAETMVTPASGVTVDQFYDYCDATRPGGNGEWALYEPGLAFNGNALHDISDFAGKNIQFQITAQYDGDHDGGSGLGLFIDDFKIYKESSASYPAPSNLVAEAGSEQVSLSWTDMNVSGAFEDIIYDNDSFDNGISMVDSTATGFAGTSFGFGAESTREISRPRG